MITLGYEVENKGRPVQVARQTLGNGHMHIRGRTRSGKTSLAILPLIEQLIPDYTNAENLRARDPVFVFDLGGDQALFHQVKRLAESQNPPRKFRFLSLERNDDWDHFDPFQAVAHGEDRVIRIANMLIEAFSLDNGLIYGGSYFTQQNLAALLRVARQLFREEKRSLSLAEIADYLDKPANRRAIRDADQVRMTFHFLLEYEQLKPDQSTDPNRMIDMLRALNDGEVIYFFTPTLNETTTARQIAGLGLYSLLNAAIQRKRRGMPSRRCWVFVDEFHELAGRAFAALLAQSGKYGLSLIMANQTTSQLDTRDTALAKVVFDNTHVKQYFTVTSYLDRKSLEDLSQTEERVLEGGYSHRVLQGTTFNARVVVEPTLKHNAILETSGTAGQSFLVIDDGSGHKDPIRVYREHKNDAKLAERLANTSLPSVNVPRPLKAIAPKSRTGGRVGKVDPTPTTAARRELNPTRQAALKELLGRKQAQEGYRGEADP
jgi:hypothetical protein